MSTGSLLTKLMPLHAAIAAELEQAGFAHSHGEYDLSDTSAPSDDGSHAVAIAVAGRDYTITPGQILLGLNLSTLSDRVVAFQYAKFPGQTLAGKLNHLVKEAQELRDNPADPNEWADVLILLLGAAAIAGHTPHDVIAAGHAKMDINDTRSWHPPDADGCYHHIKP